MSVDTVTLMSMPLPMAQVPIVRAPASSLRPLVLSPPPETPRATANSPGALVHDSFQYSVPWTSGHSGFVCSAPQGTPQTTAPTQSMPMTPLMPLTPMTPSPPMVLRKGAAGLEMPPRYLGSTTATTTASTVATPASPSPPVPPPGAVLPSSGMQSPRTVAGGSNGPSACGTSLISTVPHLGSPLGALPQLSLPLPLSSEPTAVCCQCMAPGSCEMRELRAALAMRESRINELETQLEGVWTLMESSVPARRLEEAQAHYRSALSERDGRIESQNRAIAELRRCLEEQSVELESLRSEQGRAQLSTGIPAPSPVRRAPGATRDMGVQHPPASGAPAAGLPCGAEATSGNLARPASLDLRWSPSGGADKEICGSVSTPEAVARSNGAGSPSAQVTPRRGGEIRAASSEDRESRSVQHAPFLQQRPPPLDSPPTTPGRAALRACPYSPSRSAACAAATGSSAQARPARAAAPLAGRTTAAPAADTGSMPGTPSYGGDEDLVRVGDDPIDRQVRRYFWEHPEFKVFTNKLRAGWYTFGKPIRLKVFMKMVAKEVFVRSSGTYKRLEKWLDEYRLQLSEEGSPPPPPQPTHGGNVCVTNGGCVAPAKLNGLSAAAAAKAASSFQANQRPGSAIMGGGGGHGGSSGAGNCKAVAAAESPGAAGTGNYSRRWEGVPVRSEDEEEEDVELEATTGTSEGWGWPMASSAALEQDLPSCTEWVPAPNPPAG